MQPGWFIEDLMPKPTQILLVDIVGETMSYDLYEVRDDQHVAHGLIETDAFTSGFDRLNAKFGDHAIIATRVGPNLGELQVPVGVSVRHVHLDRATCDALFGPGYELAQRRVISQPGQYVTVETVDVIGPKGELDHVAIIGPLRAETQVELARTDAIHLGVTPPVRESGHLEGTPGLQLRGPRGVLTLAHGAIIARRHVHMSPDDAHRFGVHDHDLIRIQIRGDRELELGDVVVRVTPGAILDLHLDTDEANAAGIEAHPVALFSGIERVASLAR